MPKCEETKLLITYKLLYLKLAASKSEEASIGFNLLKEIDLNSNQIDKDFSIYPFKNEPYISVASGQKVYYQNIRELEDGIALSKDSEVIDIKDYGYDNNAKITCSSFSRTENEILLGISRYANDITGSGDELRGDVLVINSKTFKLIKKYEGISGYPVDVIIKYQTYLRDGKEDGVTVSDVLHF